MTRKIILTAILSTFAAIACYAQPFWYFDNKRAKENAEPEFVVRLGLSGAPESAESYFEDGSGIFYYPAYDSDRLSQIYGDYYGPTFTGGCITGSVDIIFAKWFALTVNLGFTSMWHDLYNGITDELTGKENAATIYLVPQAKFFFINRKLVRLYGSIGGGVGKYFGYDKLKYSYRDYDNRMRYVDNSFQFEFQYSPLGIEVGKKWFGFMEFGVGTMYCGVLGGFGYRF